MDLPRMAFISLKFYIILQVIYPIFSSY